MTEKEMKKLNRLELLQLLLQQSEAQEALKDQLAEQQTALTAVKEEREAAQKRIANLEEAEEEWKKQLAEMNESMAELQEQLEKSKEKMQERQLYLNEAGSIAEASLKITNVFQAAQQSAEVYLENIKRLSEQQETISAQREREVLEKCRELERASEEKCRRLEAESEALCREREEGVRARCDSACQAARDEVERYWADLSARLESFYEAHSGMKEILSFYNMKLPDVGKLRDM